MSGGQKKDTTSLEMAVSVVMAPHQILVRRAWWGVYIVSSEGSFPQGGTIDVWIFLSWHYRTFLEGTHTESYYNKEQRVPLSANHFLWHVNYLMTCSCTLDDAPLHKSTPDALFCLLSMTIQPNSIVLEECNVIHSLLLAENAELSFSDDFLIIRTSPGGTSGGNCALKDVSHGINQQGTCLFWQSLSAQKASKLICIYWWIWLGVNND